MHPLINPADNIGGFKTGDFHHSTFIVGNGNDAVASARKTPDLELVLPGISDFILSMEEYYGEYLYKISVKELSERYSVFLRKKRASLLTKREFLEEQFLEERSVKSSIDSTERTLRDVEAFDWSKLKSEDVKIQFGNITFDGAHQIADMKFFVDIGGKAGTVIFQQRVRLPKDAILHRRKWWISDGVLTITLPKPEEFYDDVYEGEDKRKRRASQAVKEDGIHEDSRRRRRR